jgi:hypothetical protein
LRSICRNPDGLFWAGDTAQTIANGGSAFRFDDLKSFLYRVEASLLALPALMVSRLAVGEAQEEEGLPNKGR